MLVVCRSSPWPLCREVGQACLSQELKKGRHLASYLLETWEFEYWNPRCWVVILHEHCRCRHVVPACETTKRGVLEWTFRTQNPAPLFLNFCHCQVCTEGPESVGRPCLLLQTFLVLEICMEWLLKLWKKLKFSYLARKNTRKMVKCCPCTLCMPLNFDGAYDADSGWTFFALRKLAFQKRRLQRSSGYVFQGTKADSQG